MNKSRNNTVERCIGYSIALASYGTVAAVAQSWERIQTNGSILGTMGIRTRFKDLVRAQVRERLSRFDVRSTAPGPEPGAVAAGGPAKVRRPSPPNADSPARTVVRAPVLPTETTEVSSEGEGVRIRAQPSRDGQTCTFGLDRSLLSGQSWWFGDTDAATASPLASALFAQVDAIESVVVDEATLSVTVTSDHTDWTAVADNKLIS